MPAKGTEIYIVIANCQTCGLMVDNRPTRQNFFYSLETAQAWARDSIYLCPNDQVMMVNELARLK